MELKTIPLLLLSALFPFVLAAQALPATAIMRAAGPADNLNSYKSGYIAKGKGNVGQKGDIHWKSFVIFDVVSAVEELAQKPKAQLQLAFDWIKSPDDVQDVEVYYVGSLPKADLNDSDMWKIFMTNVGVKVGTLESYQLAGLKKRSWIQLDLEGKIASGEVTPVNRFMVFRVESKPLVNADGNGLVGVSPDLSQHVLTIGEAFDQDGATTGGY